MNHESRPGQPAPVVKHGVDGSLRPELVKLITRGATLEAIHFRAVQQTFLEASILYWQRRAADFAAVGTPRCDAIADACGRHARLLAGEFGEVEPWPGFADDLAAILDDVGVG